MTYLWSQDSQETSLQYNHDTLCVCVCVCVCVSGSVGWYKLALSFVAVAVIEVLAVAIKTANLGPTCLNVLKASFPQNLASQ